MDIAIAYAEMLLLALAYILLSVLDMPILFLVFAFIWAGVVIISERLR